MKGDVSSPVTLAKAVADFERRLADLREAPCTRTRTRRAAALLTELLSILDRVQRYVAVIDDLVEEGGSAPKEMRHGE